jgi:SAM-dependent methyltransferase
MDETFLSPYENPSWHAAISDIVRQTSTNRVDVRDAVLDGVDLSCAGKILDLGCGFGFMTEAIARRAVPTAPIVGMDACAANEGPYLEQAAATGHPARFICRRIDKQLDWPDDTFDLIVACYAMYFFPDALPEVARVLTPRGLFIAVTHSEQFCDDLLRVAGLSNRNSRLAMLIRAFSSENAIALLTPWFEEVERVDYHNTLSFETPQRDKLLTYLQFKMPLLLPDSQPGAELPAPVADTVQSSLSRHGRVVLNKNDTIFRCKRPRCP